MGRMGASGAPRRLRASDRGDRARTATGAQAHREGALGSARGCGGDDARRSGLGVLGVVGSKCGCLVTDPGGTSARSHALDRTARAALAFRGRREPGARHDTFTPPHAARASGDRRTRCRAQGDPASVRLRPRSSHVHLLLKCRSPIAKKHNTGVGHAKDQMDSPARARCPGIQPGHPLVETAANWVLRYAVERASHEVTEGMAAEHISAEKYDIDHQHQGSDPDSKSIGEEEGAYRIVGEEPPHDVGEPQENPMKILHDERGEGAFAPIGLARLAHRARRRIGPERLVIRSPVVSSR